MKIKASQEICPVCKSSAMVVGMSTGNMKVYGCLKCSNAQGIHLKMADAKKAWAKYVQSFESK